MPRTAKRAAPPPARRLRSMQAAAEEYAVDEVTVHRWIKSGLIHGYRIGGKLIRVDLDEIEAKVVREIVPAAGAGQ
jgi:predicted site-specific integrase-resolvase